MSIRIEIDLTDETAGWFSGLLFDLNAVASAKGEPCWTPGELASSLLRQIAEEDVAAHETPRASH